MGRVKECGAFTNDVVGAIIPGGRMPPLLAGKDACRYRRATPVKRWSFGSRKFGISRTHLARIGR